MRRLSESARLPVTARRGTNRGSVSLVRGLHLLNGVALRACARIAGVVRKLGAPWTVALPWVGEV
jgi:hypothetical protein